MLTVVLLMSCAGPSDQIAELERELAASRVALDATRNALAVFNVGALAPPACNVLDESATVRRVRGRDCDDFAAEIAATVHICVAARDDAARYAEAVQAGQRKCTEFCRQRNCPGPVYAPEPDCTAGAFGGRSASCLQNCPIINGCGLLNLSRSFNCRCIDA